MAEGEPEMMPMPSEPESQPPFLPARERTWAMLCHLSALLGYCFPFGHIFGPLAVWFFRSERSALVDDQGKESLNFQISMTLYLIGAAILILAVVGIFLLAVLVVFHFIVVIIASVRAKSGEKYRYPLTIRFLH